VHAAQDWLSSKPLVGQYRRRTRAEAHRLIFLPTIVLPFAEKTETPVLGQIEFVEESSHNVLLTDTCRQCDPTLRQVTGPVTHMVTRRDWISGSRLVCPTQFCVRTRTSSRTVLISMEFLTGSFFIFGTIPSAKGTHSSNFREISRGTHIEVPPDCSTRELQTYS
jgi:hypothetical protein